MPANDRTASISGHYAGEYQHWDLVRRTRMDYFAASATKYLSRWRKKGGLLDLEKALHYTEKLREVADNMEIVCLRPSEIWITQEVDRFCDVNELNSQERRAILILATWRSLLDFDIVRDVIKELMEPPAVPASDSNKHILQDQHDKPYVVSASATHGPR